MNSLFSTLCCIILLGVSGCTIKDKIISFEKKNNSCRATCVQHFEACKEVCTNSCTACSASSNYSSAKNFFNYMREKQIEGGFLNRGLNSYRDPLQCRKVTCNCAADYNVCSQSCGGVINKQLRSVPYCT